MTSLNYPLQYRRLKTREVTIGHVKIGADNPICIQSMLTSSTQNIQSCLDEIKSLVAVDCQLIRLTIPSRKDLDAAYKLREVLREEGIDVPLVADIHFSPVLAVDACEVFEKIRINPGNFSDKPKQAKISQSSDSFEEGYERLREEIKPLVKNLKYYNRALRIGVNQGSLSTRMMEQYGDTPLGMVNSALEMVELFEEQGVDQLVVSLKSSNPVVVQKAYRLLAKTMPEENAVPLHLGVTEAGNELMGRIKSLAGIGVLLIDGIGDTIRVSLTEPSANEIQFAREFLSSIELCRIEEETAPEAPWQRPLNHQRVENGRAVFSECNVGGGTPLKLGGPAENDYPDVDIPFQLDFRVSDEGNHSHPVGESKPFLKLAGNLESAHQKQPENCSALLIDCQTSLHALRGFYHQFMGQCSVPVGLELPPTYDYSTDVQLAGILSEGLLDFVILPNGIESLTLQRFLLLLQATRSRILVPDYIICPSCGRTLYDIQNTAAKIKEKTSHLKGVKIGIMGCIVNGPGEMADADFGYVGSGPGKIDLYFGQKRVCRGVDESEAVDRLIALMKEKGYWQER